MSTAQTTDRQLLEDAQQQLRAIVEHLARLSREEIEPDEFFGQFLPQVVTALVAVGGGVWLAAEEAASLRLAYQVNLQQAGLRNEQLQSHVGLIEEALVTGEGRIVAPRYSNGSERTSNPTDWLLVLTPIKVGPASVGVLEILQRPQLHPAAQRGYERFSQQMAELAGEYLKGRQWHSLQERQKLWREIEGFSRAIHEKLDVSSTAYTLANDGRHLIGCDRLSVAVTRGRHFTIEAVSGQDVLDRRSNAVRGLQALVDRVLAVGEPFWYIGSSEGIAPQIATVLQPYLDESHVRFLGILPLTPAAPPATTPEMQPTRPRPIGALVVEQIDEAQPREGLHSRAELVARHGTLALSHALTYRQVWLLPLWQTLARTRWLVEARNLPKTVVAAVALLILAIGMLVVPIDFNVHSPGTLQPVMRRDVFAPLDGTVEEVLVRHGDQVKAGQLIARLRNTDIEVAITDVMGQHTSAREQLASVERSLHDQSKQLTVPQRDQLAGQRAELQQRLSSLQKQWDLLREKRSRLEVHAPVAGQMTTWNVEELLAHRPVRTGQILMSIAETDGPWELELHLPEHRAGQLVEAGAKQGVTLPVTYRLATDPGVDHHGTVTEIHRAAEVRGEEGNTVLVKVSLDRDEIANLLRPGADVTAKVYCGRRSMAYVWLYDVNAFVQSKILFKLW